MVTIGSQVITDEYARNLKVGLTNIFRRYGVALPPRSGIVEIKIANEQVTDFEVIYKRKY